jgi:hypothetical protein
MKPLSIRSEIGQAFVPPSGGEGPAGREVDVLWAVAVLVTGGAPLVGVAMALRRRARRRERGG